MKKFMKWVGIGIGTLFGLALVAVFAGGLWLNLTLKDAMVPPPSPEETPGIYAYVGEEAPTPAIPRIDTRPAFAPPSLPTARPWTRWWWPGADVTTESATAQLQALHDAGFGGVEIQPFNAGLVELKETDAWDRIHSFDSKAYYQTLSAVLDKAEELGMTVDLNHLSGWPAGGPQVRLEDGLQGYVFAEKTVKGGGSISLPVPKPTPGINAYIMALGESAFGVDLSNFAADHAKLVSVVAARHVSGSRSINPLDISDTVVLDESSLTLLTDDVEDGVLKWWPPSEDDWQLIATYQMPVGQAPVLVADKHTGFVIDHFNKLKVISHYNFGFGQRTGLDKHYGRAFHGFFNDSLEFQADRLTASDMLQQFRVRRGYDLEPYLPVLSIEAFDNFYVRDAAGIVAAPAYKLGEYDDRIRYDYQKTLSDLLVERFVTASANWAGARGLRSRGQTYGVSVDTIRALGANDIPETEQLFAGGSELFMKLAYSGAALYGKPMVTAESFVWRKKAYAVSPRHMKTAADALFIAGVNQIIYHGVPYVSETKPYDDAYGQIGWYPFGGPENDSLFSNNYGPRSPLWPFVPKLNTYISRVQGLLQQGKPDVDVLIYYPFHGFPHGLDHSDIARNGFFFDGNMPDEDAVTAGATFKIPGFSSDHSEPDPRLTWIEAIMPLIETFNERGIVWAWVNDDAIVHERGILMEGEGKDGPNAETVPAILVPNITAMPPDTALVLKFRQEAGLPVILFGETPSRQPGFLHASLYDGEVQEIVGELAQAALARDTGEILARLTPRLSVQGATTLRRISRRLDAGGSVHFLVNQSVMPLDAALTVSGTSAIWFDPATGESWPADGLDRELQISLRPLEARILLVDVDGLDPGERPVRLDEAAVTQPLPPEAWTLTQVNTGTQISGGLPDWRDEEALRYSADAGIYETRVTLNEEEMGATFMLDLGRINGLATLTVNGSSVDSLFPGPYSVDVSRYLRPGDNSIQLTVTPPRWNSLVGRFLAEDPLAAQMKGQVERLVPVGLLGPVSLQKYQSNEVAP